MEEAADLESGLDPSSEHGQQDDKGDDDAADPMTSNNSSGQQQQRARPNLYDEVRRAMGGAFFMFLMADVRDMAKKGQLQGNPDYIQHLIDFPIDAFEFIELYKENKELILERIDSKERYDMYASFFDMPADADPNTVERNLRAFQYLHFADENEEEECVFGIYVNDLHKQVSVAFRGSVTPKDFAQDAKALFTPIPNPVKVPEETTDTIDPQLVPRIEKDVFVHLGFREYLYGEKSAFSLPAFIKKLGKLTRNAADQSSKLVSKTTQTLVPDSLAKNTNIVLTKAYDAVVPDFVKGMGSQNNNKPVANNVDSEANNKLDVESGAQSGGMDGDEEKTPDNVMELERRRKQYQIILDMASAVLKEKPGYDLHVCGHSLGGALATMLAFEAAAASDDYIPKPVTCITTGAPKVGNLDYLHSFELLEEQKKLRYLRVANFRDIVPLSPPDQTYNILGPLLFQPLRFRHVGLRLKLFPHGYIISYSPKMRTCPGICCCDMIKVLRHWLYLALVCPIVVFCKNRYIYKAFRTEHTQLVYMNRLDACEDILSEYSLDELYAERIQRSRLRMPTLHGGTHVLQSREEYKKKPHKAFTAILEI